eukprot:1456128-Karenia_brevis.AAC.1
MPSEVHSHGGLEGVVLLYQVYNWCELKCCHNELAATRGRVACATAPSYARLGCAWLGWRASFSLLVVKPN